MITVTQAQLTAMVGGWLWPLIRIAALLSTAPALGTRAVPARVRMVLALCISFIVAPVLPPIAPVELVSAQGVLITVQQVLIGAAMGFVLRLMFAIVDLAGQFLSQQMGLGFAAMVDPQNGMSSPVVSQYYLILATLLFFSFDGHLLALQALVGSFYSLPIGVNGLSQAGIGVLMHWSSDLFLYATMISLPTATALLVVNLGYGILSRTAPQLHIFAVGFPIIVVAGVILTSVTLGGLPQHVTHLFDESLSVIQQVLQAK
jgi:flagellar biosynthetic protein FliR